MENIIREIVYEVWVFPRTSNNVHSSCFCQINCNRIIKCFISIFRYLFSIHHIGAVDKFAMQDLRRLNLAENLIVELVPRVFYMLGKLKYLSLSGNPLIDLPPDVFKDILVRKSFNSFLFLPSCLRHRSNLLPNRFLQLIFWNYSLVWFHHSLVFM